MASVQASMRSFLSGFSGLGRPAAAGKGPGEFAGERMWVNLKEIDYRTGQMSGVLVDAPTIPGVIKTGLRMGAKVDFSIEYIIDMMPPDWESKV